MYQKSMKSELSSKKYKNIQVSQETQSNLMTTYDKLISFRFLFT